MFDPAPRAIDLSGVMPADWHRLTGQLRALESDARQGRNVEARWTRLCDEAAASTSLLAARRRDVPAIRYDDQLPVCVRRREIAAALAQHQVVIVCGETGSGKSTQLPKICLESGRGIGRLIGHTQPRRIAARSVAVRIAEELGSPLGHAVGFKIRFTDATSAKTYIKLMTDGILLAECQGDPFLDRYDTIILDEAHERSLNVDFLLGYLKRLLPKRRDLKVVITSATIDAARFAEHFRTASGPAPVVEVTGRMYPVEVRWRPLVADENQDEPELEIAICDAVDEAARIDTGDILVFMPTERAIHELTRVLRGRPIPGDDSSRKTEILPLYGRLSMQEQQRVFQPHSHRRIVIATNVAESSLTVPGIRYVIDPGTARISRYSARTKTQRLPIEAVSRASADQRSGRCGRVAPGVCIRLYAEDDYLNRDRYTAPEIQRSNLASVILQTKALQLGDIEHFELLDPPRGEAIRDGYKTLFELGALDERRQLTDIGRRLARLPVDPRIGRMILAAAEEGCLSEMLVLGAVLETQDPRDRPLERQEAADQRHAAFVDPDSDFLSYLKIWDFYHGLKGRLSRGQLRKACQQNFLSYNRMREWSDIHLQLRQLAEDAGLRPTARSDRYEAVHRAILAGLLANVATFDEDHPHQFAVAGGGKAFLWPGSGLRNATPKWIVAAEIIETDRRYLRTCAQVQPRWIEPIAGHVLKRTYRDVHWDRNAASAVATERVSLFGIAIVQGRRVPYGPIDPVVSRRMLIQHGLVEGEFDTDAPFFHHNHQLLDDAERLQAKVRRNDLVRDFTARYEFYDRHIPADVFDGARLGQWLLREQRQQPRLLLMSRDDVLYDAAEQSPDDAFPDALPTCSGELALEYKFEPGADDDGVTLTVPMPALDDLSGRQVDWLVPGLLEQKVVALIRSLPKQLRRRLVPAPNVARRAAEQIAFGEGDFPAAVAAVLSRISGQRVLPGDFRKEQLPVELQMHLRIVDARGEVVVAGRDLETLRRQLGRETAANLADFRDPRFTRDGITEWDFGDLPEKIDVHRGDRVFAAYPLLIDAGESVSMRLADTPAKAQRDMRGGLRRLFLLAAWRDVKNQVDWLPNLEKMRLHSASLPGFVVRQHLAELIADRAAPPPQTPLPRSAATFAAWTADARKRIAAAVQDVVKLAGPLLETHHQARLAVEQASAAKWAYAMDDIRGQLDRLTQPGFLCTTPCQRLLHLPRYFRAVSIRLESLRAAPARDRLHCDEIVARWAQFQQRAEEQRQQGMEDPELELFRWMIEEYRVSLFAQRLGTAMPVSAKRLDQQWAKVRE